jgi:hypothetical protein
LVLCSLPSGAPIIAHGSTTATKKIHHGDHREETHYFSVIFVPFVVNLAHSYLQVLPSTFFLLLSVILGG